jgi:hypothetical protein
MVDAMPCNHIPVPSQFHRTSVQTLITDCKHALDNNETVRAMDCALSIVKGRYSVNAVAVEVFDKLMKTQIDTKTNTLGVQFEDLVMNTINQLPRSDIRHLVRAIMTTRIDSLRVWDQDAPAIQQLVRILSRVKVQDWTTCHLLSLVVQHNLALRGHRLPPKQICALSCIGDVLNYDGDEKTSFLGDVDSYMTIYAIDIKVSPEFRLVGARNLGDCVGIVIWQAASQTVAFQHCKYPRRLSVCLLVCKLINKENTSNRGSEDEWTQLSNKLSNAYYGRQFDANVSDGEVERISIELQKLGDCYFMLACPVPGEGFVCVYNTLIKLTQSPVYYTPSSTIAIDRDTGLFYDTNIPRS